MIALFEAYQAGLLRPKHWLSNIVAGLIVGVVALPLALAFAVASGTKPEQGIYTAIIAGLVVGIFGGSRVQIAGPTGAFVVLLSGVTARFGIEGLQIATLLAGIIIVCFGLLKLGEVIKFIPEPVITGFTAGIGTIIFVNAWKDFFGLSVSYQLDTPFHQKLLLLIQSFGTTDTVTVSLAMLSLALIISAPKITRVPGPLIALVVVTSLHMYFNYASVATIGSLFGALPQQLPTLSMPSLSWHKIVVLMAPAFTIALLGAIESLLSAAIADGVTGTRHNSNQELIGQGLANIVAPFFGGFAATGAIARTITNVRNGGNSPLAAIVHSLVLISMLLLLAPLASHIPFCVLAAILVVVAYNMSDLTRCVHLIRHAPWYDVLVLIVTFFLTVFIDLVVAVSIGVILSLLFFARRIQQMVSVRRQTETEHGVALPQDIIVYQIQGPLFFGVSAAMEHALTVTHTAPKAIVLRLKEVPFIDATGLETLSFVVQHYKKQGVQVYLTEANERVKHKLDKFEITKQIAEQKIFSSLDELRIF